MRAVIYARYSSENQREASIEDQIEVCRRYIEQQQWTFSGPTPIARSVAQAISGQATSKCSPTPN